MVHQKALDRGPMPVPCKRDPALVVVAERKHFVIGAVGAVIGAIGVGKDLVIRQVGFLPIGVSHQGQARIIPDFPYRYCELGHDFMRACH